MSLLEELQKEGYDTSGITPELISDLEKEGYDTSELKGIVDTAQPTSFVDKLRSVGSKVSQLNEMTPGVQAMKAYEGIKKGFDVAGEKIAELPEQQNIIGEIAREYPTATGLAAGTAANIPNVVEAIVGSKGVMKGKDLAAQLAKKRLSSTAIGAEIGAAEKAAGLTKPLPDQKILAKNLGLPKGASPEAIVNDVESLLDAGIKVPAQQLQDIRLFMKGLFKQKKFRDPELKSVLSRAKNKVDSAFNEAVPGRVEPAKRLKQLKTAQKTLGAGAVAGGLDYVRRKLMRVLGG